MSTIYQAKISLDLSILASPHSVQAFWGMVKERNKKGAIPFFWTIMFFLKINGIRDEAKFGSLHLVPSLYNFELLFWIVQHRVHTKGRRGTPTPSPTIPTQVGWLACPHYTEHLHCVHNVHCVRLFALFQCAGREGQSINQGKTWQWRS